MTTSYFVKHRLFGNTLFMTMLTFSIVLHLTVLMVRFVAPTTNKPDTLRKSIDVTLINSQQETKASDSRKMAQSNFSGGGNTEVAVTASSPLPAAEEEGISGQTLDVRRNTVFERTKQLEQLLTQLDNRLKVNQQAPEEATKVLESGTLDIAGLEEKIASHYAEIQQMWQIHQQGKRRKFVGPNTQESVYAQYYERWRAKVEKVGTEHFPEQARNRYYGKVVLTIDIGPDGRIVTPPIIERSSSFTVLDFAAVRIINTAQPFEPFSSAMKQKYDVLTLTFTMLFTRDSIQTESVTTIRP